MTQTSLEPDVQATIEQQIASAEVVLYMKGSPKMPQCGFSAKTAGLLDSLLAGDYQAYNVLEDERIREGIKVFSDWPTIPQLYIKGEFVGGCDIITEMYNAGELHEMLGLEVPDRTPPDITITEAAAEQINAFLAQYPGQFLHFSITPDWDARFEVGPRGGHEIASEAAGLTVLMDLATAQRAQGATIDWIESMQGSGLKLDLPGAPPPVQKITAEALQARLNQGEDIWVVDTRPEPDREATPVDFAKPLDADMMQKLKDADPHQPVVFMCHVGITSLKIAEHYRKQGMTQLFNLEGGVEAVLGGSSALG